MLPFLYRLLHSRSAATSRHPAWRLLLSGWLLAFPHFAGSQQCLGLLLYLLFPPQIRLRKGSPAVPFPRARAFPCRGRQHLAISVFGLVLVLDLLMKWREGDNDIKIFGLVTG